MLSLPSTQQIVLMQGYMNRPIMADAPRWFLDKEMTRKCNIPPSPYVPYWVVAQREDTDVSALQGLIDIADDDESDDGTDEMIEAYEDDREYGVDDFEDEEFLPDEDEGGETMQGEGKGEYDSENYDDYIDEKF